jgi:hypothetical protein
MARKRRCTLDNSLNDLGARKIRQNMLLSVRLFVAEGGYSINVHRLLVSPLQGPQTAPKHDIRLSC